MPSIYRQPHTDPTLQMLLENRIKRHGITASYNRGCRCERCIKAISVTNKKQYESFGERIRENSNLRSKYAIQCKNWIEEYFPEVAQQIKNEIAGEK